MLLTVGIMSTFMFIFVNYSTVIINLLNMGAGAQRLYDPRNEVTVVGSTVIIYCWYYQHLYVDFVNNSTVIINY